MKYYELYGIKSDNIQKSREVIEDVLGLKFIKHESFYLGEYFMSGEIGAQHFLLQENFNEQEEEWTEYEHKDFKILLYLSEASEPGNLDVLLKNSLKVKLLRQEVK